MNVRQMIKWRDRTIHGVGNKYYPIPLRIKLVKFIQKYEPTKQEIEAKKEKKRLRAEAKHRAQQRKIENAKGTVASFRRRCLAQASQV